MHTVDVLLSGSILPGTDLSTAAANLAKQTGIDQSKAEALISSGQSRVVKRGVSTEIGQAYLDKLTAMGIGASLQPSAVPERPQPADKPGPLSVAPAVALKQEEKTDTARGATTGSEVQPPNPYSAPTADLNPDRHYLEASWRDVAEKVPASHGILWIKQAWGLFRSRPFTWIGAMILVQILFFFVHLLLSWTGVGPVIVTGILGVLFAGGAVLMAHKQIEGEPMGALGIFTCFRQDTLQLLLLGALNIFCWLIGAVLVYLLLGMELFVTLSTVNSSALPAVLMQHGSGILLALLLAVLLGFLFMLGMIAAPTLVVLTGENALTAIYKSLLAGLKNWSALLVNFAVLMLITLGVGVAFGLLLALTSILPSIIAPLVTLLTLLAFILAGMPLFGILMWLMPYLVSRDLFYEAP